MPTFQIVIIQDGSVIFMTRLEQLPLLPGTTYDPTTGLALPYSSEYVADLTARVLTGARVCVCV
jgi:hypothetical protein